MPEKMARLRGTSLREMVRNQETGLQRVLRSKATHSPSYRKPVGNECRQKVKTTG